MAGLTVSCQHPTIRSSSTRSAPLTSFTSRRSLFSLRRYRPVAGWRGHVVPRGRCWCRDLGGCRETILESNSRLVSSTRRQAASTWTKSVMEPMCADVPECSNMPSGRGSRASARAEELFRYPRFSSPLDEHRHDYTLVRNGMSAVPGCARAVNTGEPVQIQPVRACRVPFIDTPFASSASYSTLLPWWKAPMLLVLRYIPLAWRSVARERREHDGYLNGRRIERSNSKERLSSFVFMHSGPAS